MNDDNLNMEIRKFLKKVGITSQREITNAIVKAVDNSELSGSEILPVMVTIEIPTLELSLEIGGDIALA